MQIDIIYILFEHLCIIFFWFKGPAILIGRFFSASFDTSFGVILFDNIYLGSDSDDECNRPRFGTSISLIRFSIHEIYIQCRSHFIAWRWFGVVEKKINDKNETESKNECECKFLDKKSYMRGPKMCVWRWRTEMPVDATYEIDLKIVLIFQRMSFHPNRLWRVKCWSSRKPHSEKICHQRRLKNRKSLISHSLCKNMLGIWVENVQTVLTYVFLSWDCRMCRRPYNL